LNFELNRQLGRVRGLNLSVPLLALPWTIIHPMDRHSPLFNATYDSLMESRAEIIAVLDGINEAVSDTFQARYSYLASEIVWNARFVPIVSQRGGKFVVDYSKFHDIVPIISEFTSRPCLHRPASKRSSMRPVSLRGSNSSLNNSRSSQRYSQRSHLMVNHSRTHNHQFPLSSTLLHSSSSNESHDEDNNNKAETIQLVVPNLSQHSNAINANVLEKH